MISLELAQALRDAGVKWKPQLGDCYRMSNGKYTIFNEDRNFEFFRSTINTRNHGIYQNLLMPRLEQLFAEIEKRGYAYVVHSKDFHITKDYVLFECYLIDDTSMYKSFRATTIEEAAAQALLWILKEGENCE